MENLEEKFKEAVNSHQKKDLKKAEELLTEILEIEPNHINTNFFWVQFCYKKKTLIDPENYF